MKHRMTCGIDIYSPPGTKLVFAYPNNGYDPDVQQAAQHLTVGQVYTLMNKTIGGFMTRIRLQEVPDQWFNSAHFADLNRMDEDAGRP